MKKVIGWILLTIMMGGIFALFIINYGLRDTVIATAIVVGGAGLLMFSLYLITEGR